jgi:serine/threonine protein kinase
MVAQALSSGTLIGGRFEVSSLLGTGGLGELYQALDQKTQKPVAIRILAGELARSEAAMEQLRNQVKLASGLSHKNAARVFGMGKEGSYRYIASEFIDGNSLRQLVERKRRTGKTFSLKGAYNVIAHVCNALETAHQSMVHGLPGLGSILINRSGRVKLADFGLVRAITPNSGVIDQLTDSYAMAPEMRVDPAAAGPAADVFTLGVVLYELLTGQPPASPPEPMGNLVAGVPIEVEEVVTRCLQTDPAARFANAQEVKAALYSAIKATGELDDQPAERAGGLDPLRTASDIVPPSAPSLATSSQPSAAQNPPVAAVTPEIPASKGRSGPVVPATKPAPAAQQPAPQPAPAPKRAPRANPLDASMAAPSPAASNPLAGQVGPAAGASMQLRVEDLLAANDDDAEVWLIQKDRLDFGPFSLGEVKRQLHQREFSPDDIIVDQESGQRGPIRKNPQLAEFVRVLERQLQAQDAEKNQQEASRREGRRRTVLITIITVSIFVLGGGGFAVWYFLLRKPPEAKERIVYRDRPGAKLNIQVAFHKEDADQAKKRRKWKRRRKRKRRHGSSGGSASNITRLGDASKSGGDALLSQTVIQNVMARNLRKLTGCVQKEYRRNPSLRRVKIDFGVKGSGMVSYSKVNGMSAGPFHACVAGGMRAIRFPKYDGAMTRASFTMTLRF